MTMAEPHSQQVQGGTLPSQRAARRFLLRATLRDLSWRFSVVNLVRHTPGSGPASAEGKFGGIDGLSRRSGKPVIRMLAAPGAGNTDEIEIRN